MAETRSVIMPGDATITFYDGSGTPKTYSIVVQNGGFTLMDGEYDHVFPNDANGVPLSGGIPRQSGVRGLCGFKFSGTVWDAGDNSTDATLADVFRWDGYVGSNWTSTTSSPDSTIKTIGAKVVWADRGSVKGATWDYPHCRLESAFEPTAGPAGLKVDITLRSINTVKPTITRTV